MALTRVRAKIKDQWVTLAYNPATGRYEGEADAPGTSANEPGGYYPVVVEITNDTGKTAQLSGVQHQSLRLAVRETVAPRLAVVSPPPGYLTTSVPEIVVEAVDEEGGSGIDRDTFTPTPRSVTAIPGGYRYTWTPSPAWGEGRHLVTFSVRDRDGNVGTVSAAYTVDTVPPQLLLLKPYMRHVVDDYSIAVTVSAQDSTSGVKSVTVGGEAAAPLGDGRFWAPVPLEVGENHIQIVAEDWAGNTAREELYMIRMVTDRNRGDIEAIQALWPRPAQLWTAEESARWAAAVKRGAWSAETLNRVGIAVRFLAGELVRRGYDISVSPKTNWTDRDAPTLSQVREYLDNVEAVTTAQEVPVTEIPGDLRMAALEDFNAIERALVETDAIFPLYLAWTAAEITSGEV